jgi:DNA-binding MarR family transcriptional regulator
MSFALTPTPPRKAGRPKLDRPEQVTRQHMRLRMLLALAEAQSLTFAQLLEITGARSGNLSSHARTLESFGFITIEKSFVGRFPRTEYRLTPAGSAALREQLDGRDSGLGR